jgi:pimeloyl-ACP methyl ester carboxylesterase
MRSDGVPEVRYARSGDVSIAYQLVGDSPRDLVFVPTFSNLVYPWWNEDFRTFYERLGAFARLILLDKRGTGLSDRPRDLGTLESRIDDIRAVLDAAGSKTAILLGTGEGGQICTFFAATYPERTQALILYGTPARAVREDDYPFGPTSEQWRELVREVRERWGEREYFEQQAREAYGATAADELVDWYVECQRFCASPVLPSPSTEATGTPISVRCSRRFACQPLFCTGNGIVTSHSILPRESRSRRRSSWPGLTAPSSTARRRAR